MCGIVGYIGGNQAAPILLGGLEKLEYRGYDSAGVAVYTEDTLRAVKGKGRLRVLSDLMDGGKLLQETIDISHTRWATHGKSSDINSHPQMSNSGKFAVVHNDVIEDYQEIKEKLLKKGVSFVLEADTKVVAQLLEYYYDGDILDAFTRVISRLQGFYAPSMLCADGPDKLYVVRKDSPLVASLGEHGNYVASDIPSILNRTRDLYHLKDNGIVQLTRDSVQICNLEKEPIEEELVHIDWDLSVTEKSGYEHFIFEGIMGQPKALRDMIPPRIKDGRIMLDNVILTAEQLQEFDRISIMACSSAYHVGVVARYVIEKLTRIPVKVDVASEFRYRHPILDSNSLVIVINQSGEAADTLAALCEAKRLSIRVIPIVNVVGSSIANDSDDILYTWAGPEIAVATTKAHSAQLAVVYLLTIYIADLLGHLTPEEYVDHVRELRELSSKVKRTLENKENIQYFVPKHFNAKDIFFIGHNLDYAISLEGSLKLKEISYIHSKAYIAGELRHGTIPLMEEGALVVAIAIHQQLLEKMMSNVIEVRSRDTLVLGLTTEDSAQEIGKNMDFLFSVPTACEIMRPSLAVIPLQLLTYCVVSMKGRDIDEPRNLAKSVTVE